MGTRVEAVHLDATEVLALAEDLDGAKGRFEKSAVKIMRRGAVKVKAGMRKDFSGHRYAPRVGLSVNYDFWHTPGRRVGFEVGPDKSIPGLQGALGNILAFGTINNLPVVDKDAAMRHELPVLTQYLGRAAEQAVLGNTDG